MSLSQGAPQGDRTESKNSSSSGKAPSTGPWPQGHSQGAEKPAILHPPTHLRRKEPLPTWARAHVCVCACVCMCVPERVCVGREGLEPRVQSELPTSPLSSFWELPFCDSNTTNTNKMISENKGIKQQWGWGAAVMGAGAGCPYPPPPL